MSAAQASYALTTSRAVNRQRKAHDIRKLRLQSCLVAQAQARATAMARSGRLVHSVLSSVMSTCGLTRAGENIANGYATGRATVDVGWMGSPPHRRNVLATGFRTMGVGAAQGATGVWYVALVLGR